MPARSFRFGVSASHGGPQLLDGANQFTRALSQAVGVPMRLWVASDYERLQASLTGGAVDMAWLPPLLLGRALADQVPPLAVSQREGSVTYRSALLTRMGSRFDAPARLQGARAAWVDPGSSSGYLFPCLHLLDAGLNPSTLFTSTEFVGSFSRALAAVAHDKADLCACFVRDQAHAPGAAQQDVQSTFGWVTDRLRVIAVTSSIPPDGLVLARAVEEPIRGRIRTALLDLHHGRAGAHALATLLRADRLVPPDGDVLAMLERLPGRAARLGSGRADPA